MVLRAAVAAAFVVILACSMVSVAQGPPGGGRSVVGEESREQTTDFECEMSCSPEKPHAPTVELRWDPVKDKRAEKRTEQRIETTVYKTGFTQGDFAALPLAGGAKPAAPGVKFARLDKTSGKKLPPSLELKVTKAELAGTPKAKGVLRAEGLEPGLTYFWRFSSRVGNDWITSQTVRCQVPVCPVDSNLGPLSPP